MSLFRRAGAAIARFFESAADPAAAPNEFKLYSKDTAGVSQLYGRSDDGTVHQITPPGAGGGIDLIDQPASTNGPSPTMQFQALAVTPDDTKVYVGSQGGPEAWRFATATDQWITTPPAALALNYVRQFCYNATGTKLYVLLLSDGNNIYIVDVATNTITGTVAGAVGFFTSMALNPAGTELWVPDVTAGGFIHRIDTTTDTEIASFAAGITNVNNCCFNPAGNKFYAIGATSLALGPRLIVYNTATFLPITTFSDTKLFDGIVALPNNTEIWIASQEVVPNGAMLRWSVAGDVFVGAPIPFSQLGSGYHLQAKSDSSKVYALLSSGDIDVFSVGGLAVVNTIAMSGDFAGDLDINTASTKLYASKTQGALPYWVKVVDVATETVIDTITSSDVTPAAPINLGPISQLSVEGARLSVVGPEGFIELPVVFDDIPTTYANIKANRSVEPSINDQTKTGITNFGSLSTASGDYSTIGGGLQNVASAEGATVPGGEFNEASGVASFASGFGSFAVGEGSMANNVSECDGDYGATFNYGFTDTGTEASNAFNDGFIDPDTYGSNASNGGAIADNCDYCHAEGANSFIDSNTSASHSEGRNTYIGQNVDGSHVEGRSATCEADYSHVEGESCQVGLNSFASHAEGGGCSVGASAPNGHAEGTATDANGYYSHAQNGASLASGEGSHSEGDGGWALANWSRAQGSSSKSSRETQMAHGGGYSGGFGGGVGAAVAQNSWLVWRGQTAGVGINESTLLRYGVSSGGFTNMFLEDLRAYNFTLTAVINGKQAGPVYVTRTIKKQFCMRRIAGVATLVASGADVVYGDAATATWTLTAAAVAGGLELTFDTGAGTASQCYVSTQVEFQEVRFAA